MPAPGRCRCRCRPRSAGADPISTSCRVQLNSCDPKMLIYPPEIGAMAPKPRKLAECRGSRLGRTSPTRPAPDADAARRPRPTTSPICNIRADRRASRTASRSRTRAAHQSRRAFDRDACRRRRSLRVVAALVSRHGAGRLLPVVVANQVSTDYLKTEDFARRPLAWLDLISRNPGTTLSYSPTFGYDICARRMSSQTKASDRFDLSRWRVAGNGADMIRPDVMQSFVDAFGDAGFKAAPSCRATAWPKRRWPSRSCRRAKASASNWSRKPSCRASAAGAGSPAALPRDRQLRQAGARHEDRDPRGGRHPASRARDRQGLVRGAVA